MDLWDFFIFVIYPEDFLFCYLFLEMFSKSKLNFVRNENNFSKFFFFCKIYYFTINLNVWIWKMKIRKLVKMIKKKKKYFYTSDGMCSLTFWRNEIIFLPLYYQNITYHKFCHISINKISLMTTLFQIFCIIFNHVYKRNINFNDLWL